MDRVYYFGVKLFLSIVWSKSKENETESDNEVSLMSRVSATSVIAYNNETKILNIVNTVSDVSFSFSHKTTKIRDRLHTNQMP